MKTELSEHKYAIVAAIGCALAYLTLALNSQGGRQADLFDLFWVCGFCALVTFALWDYYRRQHKRIPVVLLLLSALVFRLVGVGTFSILEDDFYRYLWDGYMWVEHGSPYGVAPAKFFQATTLSPAFEDILDGINHPDIPTIYGPLCQWLFAFGYWLAPWQLWPLQLIYCFADFGIVLLLLRLTHSNNVLLYAWSPLIIKEFAFTAHPDVLGVFFLLMAVLAARSRYVYRAAFFLALSAGIKIFALIATPFLLRLNWRAWGLFLLVAATLALPFGLVDAWLPKGLSAMAQGWLFNAPIYLVLEPLLAVSVIKFILLGAYGMFCVLYLYRLKVWKSQTGEPVMPFRGDWLYGLFLLVLPVLNTWYLVWLLPFAAIYPSRCAWAASIAILLAYVTGLNLGGDSLGLYQQPTWALTLEFAIVMLACFFDLRARHQKH